MLALWKKSYEQPRQHIKKQRRYFDDKYPSSQSYGVSSGHYGCESWTIKKAECQRIDAWSVMFKRRLLESLGLQGDQTSQSSRKSTLNIYWKDWCWSWNSNTWAPWCEELTPWKRPWCWERLKAGEEADDRGWDVRMASLTGWTWDSRASSGSW